MKKIKLTICLALVLIAIFAIFKTNAETPPNVTINEDFFSEFGMTKKQLEEKFEIQFGEVFGSDFKVKERGTYTFDGEQCVGISDFDMKNLFPYFPQNATVAELTSWYNLSLLESYDKRLYRNSSYFLWDHFIIQMYIMDDGTFTEQIEVYDLTYYNNMGMGFDTKTIPSRYQIFYDFAIGIPDDATVEDFLNDL